MAIRKLVVRTMGRWPTDVNGKPVAVGEVGEFALTTINAFARLRTNWFAEPPKAKPKRKRKKKAAPPAPAPAIDPAPEDETLS